MTDAIKATESWLQNTVIDLNLCPFAIAPFKAKSIAITEISSSKEQAVLEGFLEACQSLEQTPELSTVLLVLSQGFEDFHRYLTMLDTCQKLLEMEGFEGVFQLASFHPEYYFDGTDIDDPSNFTNRSPLPIIHILREDELLNVTEEEGERIYQRNMQTCEQKGLKFLQALLQKNQNL